MNSKEKLWNANYIKVMTTNFLLYFAFYLLTPLLPLYLSETFGATKDTIGIVLSGYTVAALIVRPFCGYVVDSFSRKKVLMLCLSGFAVFFAGYIAAGTILMFAICRTLHGGPFGAVTVANSTCAIDVLPSSRRNEGIGLYGLSNNFAMAIAPSIGIYLHNMVDSYMILFWIAFVVAISAVLIAWTIRLPEKDIIRNKEKLSLDRFFLTRAWLLAINIAMFGFCWGVLSNYLAIYSKEVLSITGGTGTYFALLSMGLFSSRLQGRKALSQGKLTQNAAEGMLISLVGFTLFVAIPHPVAYYLSAILIGLGNGHLYPAFLNMFVHVARHDQRGTANSSILTGWDLGFGIGCLLGGIVAEHFGYTATFWMVAAENAVSVILFFLASRQFFERRKILKD
ncbi:MAG: MFS transporter [Prevotella sp.]|jgi:predicted MFS family arabinose efflux permease|uniref:MFS transporter n=1 Tax=Segatella intestinalis TaxID=3035284 RepID=UPI00034046E1|nr:MFS transporter [Prevotella sp. B2-R-102]MBD9073995.1 MFS transporter [Prevotella sp.]CDC26677.1 putative transmembrane transport protein [Prevotella sp. CAG:386]MBD9261946.1 MFS transporter [Prevotella sp.]MDF4242183.1 MFS transporter [Prevotella sp. B2-R-102]HCD65780.1 MFS transporter [Prevotella sp.]